jgi:hypothetical protein
MSCPSVTMILFAPVVLPFVRTTLKGDVVGNDAGISESKAIVPLASN